MSEGNQSKPPLKVVVLTQNRVTKNTVRYQEPGADKPIQIYLQKAELPLPYPGKVKVTVEVEG